MKASDKICLFMAIVCSIVTILTLFTDATIIGKVITTTMVCSFGFGIIFLIGRIDNKPKEMKTN